MVCGGRAVELWERDRFIARQPGVHVHSVTEIYVILGRAHDRKAQALLDRGCWPLEP
jgi:hypothetical protein